MSGGRQSKSANHISGCGRSRTRGRRCGSWSRALEFVVPGSVHVRQLWESSSSTAVGEGCGIYVVLPHLLLSPRVKPVFLTSISTGPPLLLYCWLLPDNQPGPNQHTNHHKHSHYDDVRHTPVLVLSRCVCRSAVL